MERWAREAAVQGQQIRRGTKTAAPWDPQRAQDCTCRARILCTAGSMHRDLHYPMAIAAKVGGLWGDGILCPALSMHGSGSVLGPAPHSWQPQEEQMVYREPEAFRTGGRAHRELQLHPWLLEQTAQAVVCWEPSVRKSAANCPVPCPGRAPAT